MWVLISKGMAAVQQSSKSATLKLTVNLSSSDLQYIHFLMLKDIFN